MKYVAAGSEWDEILFPKTRHAVELSNEEHRGYRDRKYVMRGFQGQRLTLRLPRKASTEQSGYIALCEPWSLGTTNGWINLSPSAIRVLVNGTPVGVDALERLEAVQPFVSGPCMLVHLGMTQSQSEYLVEVEATPSGNTQLSDVQGCIERQAKSMFRDRDICDHVVISHVLWR